MKGPTGIGPKPPAAGAHEQRPFCTTGVPSWQSSAPHMPGSRSAWPPTSGGPQAHSVPCTRVARAGPQSTAQHFRCTGLTASKPAMHRVHEVFAFGEFSRDWGAAVVADLPDHVEAFVAERVARHAKRTG